MTKRLISRKRSMARVRKTDSVADRTSKYLDNRYNIPLLEYAENVYNNLEKFREERARAFRYVYGYGQWDDVIIYNGKAMTEAEYIRKEGNVPLVNNVMRALVNTLVGVYAKQDTEPVCYARNRDDQEVSENMTTSLQCNWQNNRMRDLLTTEFEEYLVSGAAINREAYDYDERGILDSWSSYCDPNDMFWEGGNDPRHKDLNMIGQLHSIPFNELCSRFCRPDIGLTVEDMKELYHLTGEWYEYKSGVYTGEETRLENISFRAPKRASECKVIEIWTHEIKDRYRCWDTNSGKRYKINLDEIGEIEDENRARAEAAAEMGMDPNDVSYILVEQFTDSYWYYQYLTPDGFVLYEGESPYEHGDTPYTIKLYPFVGGEIHSFAYSIIDQQRYINRLIMMQDMIMRSSAKGLTFVPSDAIPDDMTNEEFLQQFSDPKGVVIYKRRPGSDSLPTQAPGATGNVGVTETLQIMLELINTISSVHGSLQGKTPQSGTSGARYAMESQNATTAIYPILSKFTEYTEEIAAKKVRNIQQFYEDGRSIAINGKYQESTTYKAMKMIDVHFAISIKDSIATPDYRMAANEWLMQMFGAGAIDIEDLLTNADLPFADKLLQSIKRKKEQMAAGQNDGSPAISPELMQEVQGMSNQDAVAAARQYAMS